MLSKISEIIWSFPKCNKKEFKLKAVVGKLLKWIK